MRRRTRLSLLATPAILSLIFAGGVLGQPAAPAPAEKESTAKFRGRLPAYFAAVVTQKQRETIYEIQARAHTQILRLQQQIEQLQAARDQEVDGVLDTDQMEHVKRKRMEAEQRRRARSGRSNPGGETASSTSAS